MVVLTVFLTCPLGYPNGFGKHCIIKPLPNATNVNDVM